MYYVIVCDVLFGRFQLIYDCSSLLRHKYTDKNQVVAFDTIYYVESTAENKLGIVFTRYNVENTAYNNQVFEKAVYMPAHRKI